MNGTQHHLPTLGIPHLLPSEGLHSEPSHSLSLTDIRTLLVNYGSQSSAHFIHQDGVRLYGSLVTGMIAYATQRTLFGETRVVFNNPICASENLDALLDSYLTQQSVPTVFVAVDRAVASRLRARGYRATQIGMESTVTLSQFDVQGKNKKQLRHASNFGKRTPCQVLELPWADVDSQQVLALSDQWRSQKAGKQQELKWVTRPPVFKDEWQVRKFYCLQEDRVLGFVFFDPYFENGQIKGYCANIVRSLPDVALSGVTDYIILEAIKQFRKEGVKELSLGISPHFNIQAEPGDWGALRHVLRLMYRHGNALYAFGGLAYHKTRYRPDQEPWYLCSKGIGLPRVLWTLITGFGVV